MNSFDFIELDILKKLVDDALQKIEKDDMKVPEQYEFDLRILNHKLEVLKRSCCNGKK